VNAFTVMSDTDLSPPSDYERHVFDKPTFRSLAFLDPAAFLVTDPYLVAK
jgi:hypothetical protein